MRLVRDIPASSCIEMWLKGQTLWTPVSKELHQDKGCDLEDIVKVVLCQRQYCAIIILQPFLDHVVHNGCKQGSTELSKDV